MELIFLSLFVLIRSSWLSYFSSIESFYNLPTCYSDGSFSYYVGEDDTSIHLLKYLPIGNLACSGTEYETLVELEKDTLEKDEVIPNIFDQEPFKGDGRPQSSLLYRETNDMSSIQPGTLALFHFSSTANCGTLKEDDIEKIDFYYDYPFGQCDNLVSQTAKSEKCSCQNNRLVCDSYDDVDCKGNITQANTPLSCTSPNNNIAFVCAGDNDDAFTLQSTLYGIFIEKRDYVLQQLDLESKGDTTCEFYKVSGDTEKTLTYTTCDANCEDNCEEIESSFELNVATVYSFEESKGEFSSMTGVYIEDEYTLDIDDTDVVITKTIEDGDDEFTIFVGYSNIALYAENFCSIDGSMYNCTNEEIYKTDYENIDCTGGITNTEKVEASGETISCGDEDDSGNSINYGWIALVVLFVLGVICFVSIAVSLIIDQAIQNKNRKKVPPVVKRFLEEQQKKIEREAGVESQYSPKQNIEVRVEDNEVKEKKEEELKEVKEEIKEEKNEEEKEEEEKKEKKKSKEEPLEELNDNEYRGKYNGENTKVSIFDGELLVGELKIEYDDITSFAKKKKGDHVIFTIGVDEDDKPERQEHISIISEKADEFQTKLIAKMNEVENSSEDTEDSEDDE